MESSWTGDWTCVPGTGNWVLNHWMTREGHGCFSTVYRSWGGPEYYSKTTYIIHAMTTPKAKAVFSWTQMRFRHLTFLQQHLQAADCSHLGYWTLPSWWLPISLSQEFVRDLIWGRDSEERKNKKAHRVSCHYLRLATSVSFSDASLAQAKERGVILNSNEIVFFNGLDR